MGSPQADVPAQLFTDPAAEARWRARFTTPRMPMPMWAADAPQRCIYITTTNGVHQVHALDLDNGAHHQVSNTDTPVGVGRAAISPDGRWVWWFADTDGSETGIWMRRPYPPWLACSMAEPAVPGLPAGYPTGLALGRRSAAIGLTTRAGAAVWVTQPGESLKVVHAGRYGARLVAMSADETLLALTQSGTDGRSPALSLINAADGTLAATSRHGGALAFSPIPGDQRLLVVRHRRGWRKLLIWDPVTSDEIPVGDDLPGDLTATWYPDGRMLLIIGRHRARSTLHRYDPETEQLTSIDVPRGNLGAAQARPDDTIWYSGSSGAASWNARVLTHDGADRPLVSQQSGPPASEPLRDLFAVGPGGPVHALVATPALGKGPCPTVFALHGGPRGTDVDRYSPERAAWLDAGFAVIHVNYRGSLGYGTTWRDAIIGRPGLTELEDLTAVWQAAVADGTADPTRCVLTGQSWGGYLTLLALGTQPTRWAAGIADVPLADLCVAYQHGSTQLRVFLAELFDGTPEQVADRYRQACPTAYVAHIRAPLLVLAGDNDSRCQPRQLDSFLSRLSIHGKAHQIYRFAGGHSTAAAAERQRQTALRIHFARQALSRADGGKRPPVDYWGPRHG